MERRKLLLGTGAAFATAIAGCTGLGDDGNEDPNDDDDGSDDNDDNDWDDDGDGHTDKIDDVTVPGYDLEKLAGALEKHGITIRDVKYENGELWLTLHADVTTERKAKKNFEDHHYELGSGIHDEETFRDELERLHLTVLGPEKTLLLEATIDVALLLEILEGLADEDELFDD